MANAICHVLIAFPPYLILYRNLFIMSCISPLPQIVKNVKFSKLVRERVMNKIVRWVPFRLKYFFMRPSWAKPWFSQFEVELKRKAKSAFSSRENVPEMWTVVPIIFWVAVWPPVWPAFQLFLGPQSQEAWVCLRTAVLATIGPGSSYLCSAETRDLTREGRISRGNMVCQLASLCSQVSSSVK